MIIRALKISVLFMAFLAVTGAAAYLTLTMIIKSEDTVVVPDLMGKDVVYSLEILTDLGLNTKVKGSEYSDDIPKNHVIFQEPGPGSEIKKGRDIRILLSKGAKIIPMPNLTGLSSRQARLMLEENGLCFGNHTYVFCDGPVSKETVMAQTPSKGTLTSRGTCVNLLLSMGPRPMAYRMMELKGLSVDEAIVLIEKSHLQVGGFRYEFHHGKPANTIVGQNPLPGYRVTENSPVDLLVNKNPDRRKSADSDRIQNTGLFRHKLDAGFLKKRVQVRMDSMGMSIELYNQFLSPGEELWLLIPTNTIATLFLYEDGDLVRTQVFNAW